MTKIDKAILVALLRTPRYIHSDPDLTLNAFKRALQEHGCVVIHEADTIEALRKAHRGWLGAWLEGYDVEPSAI